ncbi:hypothetical protein ACS2B2_25715 [Bacillus cereus group sp. BceL297]|uniref:hypothetical protein n=1 Tax=unclassified Bacillus cereus group TaxID=2750818 RepID=UPI003F28AB99
MPKPPAPKPPSGGGGNTNNCNVLCNAIPSSLALANALNAAMPGGQYYVELNYNLSATQTIVLAVQSVNLQNCTIRGVELGTTNNITVSCAFAFANFVELKVTSGPH